MHNKAGHRPRHRPDHSPGHRPVHTQPGDTALVTAHGTAQGTTHGTSQGTTQNTTQNTTQCTTKCTGHNTGQKPNKSINTTLPYTISIGFFNEICAKHQIIENTGLSLTRASLYGTFWVLLKGHPSSTKMFGATCVSQHKVAKKTFGDKVGFKKTKTGFKHKQKALENN